MLLLLHMCCKGWYVASFCGCLWVLSGTLCYSVGCFLDVGYLRVFWFCARCFGFAYLWLFFCLLGALLCIGTFVG